MEHSLATAAEAIHHSHHLVAFTGAGISVESGIPPFRGENGLWSRYDPSILEIGRFLREPEECWPVIRLLFFDHFAQAEPNPMHHFLAALEADGKLEAVITQNIDNLHHRAGSRNIIEYHGNSRELICTACGGRHLIKQQGMPEDVVPRCGCGGVYKPDFIFFGEAIPPKAAQAATRYAKSCDTMIVAGTTGEVYPAAMIPRIAADKGATIIEINPEPSAFTNEITHIHIEAAGTEAACRLSQLLGLQITGCGV
jgi:NAD-dependent deacetylase